MTKYIIYNRAPLAIEAADEPFKGPFNIVAVVKNKKGLTKLVTVSQNVDWGNIGMMEEFGSHPVTLAEKACPRGYDLYLIYLELLSDADKKLVADPVLFKLTYGNVKNKPLVESAA